MTSANAQRAGANLIAASDVFSTSHLLSTNHGTVSIQLRRVYYSGYCRWYYVGTIGGMLVAVGWTVARLGDWQRQWWFVGAEVGIGTLVVGEIIGRLVMLGFQKFIRSWLTLIDLLITFLSLLGLIYAFQSSTFLGCILGLSSQTALILRTLIQYLRLIVFVQNQEKAQAIVLQVINFSELAQPSRITRKQPIEASIIEPSKLHLTEEFDEKDGFVGIAKKQLEPKPVP